MRRAVVVGLSVSAWVGGPGSASAHPDLYYGADDVAVLQARAADDTPTEQGWSYGEVFDAFVPMADAAIATPYSYTVDIPDVDGSGSASWTYTLSAEMPGPHPNNPQYPPWTKVSRDLENRLLVLAFVWAMRRTSEGAAEASDGGCACRAREGRERLAPMALLAAVAVLRRRRRAANTARPEDRGPRRGCAS